MKRIPMQPKEYDVLTEWRRVYCYTKRAGACARREASLPPARATLRQDLHSTHA